MLPFSSLLLICLFTGSHFLNFFFSTMILFFLSFFSCPFCPPYGRIPGQGGERPRPREPLWVWPWAVSSAQLPSKYLLLWWYNSVPLDLENYYNSSTRVIIVSRIYLKWRGRPGEIFLDIEKEGQHLPILMESNPRRKLEPAASSAFLKGKVQSDAINTYLTNKLEWK